MPDLAKLRTPAAALAAFVAVFALIRVLDRGGDEPAAAVAIDGVPAVGPQDSGQRRGERLWVHVAGAVRRPGLYRVPHGARVGAAVARAGGPTRRADQAAVNFAEPLRDGQQVVVPRRGATAAAAPPTASATQSPTGDTTAPGAAAPKISLATATAEQLDTLDGIGPTLAARIIEYRDSHGGFRSLDELRQVDGIGEKRFAALRAGLRP